MTTETRSATELFNRCRCRGFGGNPQDTRFKALVDMMVSYMLHEKIAPDEIRDAAFVASVQFANLQPVRRMVYERDDLNWPESHTGND